MFSTMLLPGTPRQQTSHCPPPSRSESCLSSNAGCLSSLECFLCGRRLSTPFHKYDHVCCVDFRFWRGATREHPPQWAVTEEQRSQNRKATQPSGRRFFS